jgi:hypothetical protein
MEKTYLKCNTEEGEFVNEYVVTIPLSNGNVHSGNVEKKHFKKKGLMKVLLVEDRGEEALILLPKRINQKEVLKISTEYLAAA